MVSFMASVLFPRYRIWDDFPSAPFKQNTIENVPESECDNDAIRATLDRRYDELRSGQVQAIDGEEVRRQMKARTQAQRDRRA